MRIQSSTTMEESYAVISRQPPSSLRSGDDVVISDYNGYAADNLADEGDLEALKNFNPEVEERSWGTQLDDSYDLELTYQGSRKPEELVDFQDPLTPEDQRESFNQHFEADELVGETLDNTRGELNLWEDSKAPDISVYTGTSWPEEALGKEEKPWKALEKHGVFGGVDPIYFGGLDPVSDLDESYLPTYFSGDAQMALSHSETYDKGMIEFSLQELAEERDIFIDPEGLHLTEEIGKSFVVMGGIPGNCIEKVHYFK
jgi:hypothetical protein